MAVLPMELWAFWLILGVVLCLAELVFPTAFIEFAMGLAALIVAAIAGFVPSFLIQAGLWLLLSGGVAWLSRRLLPRRRPIATLKDADEAETLTAILPGKKGRVLYEGNSWQACCDDSSLEIGPHQKVYVLRREGTTLIVMPQLMLDA